jgi:protein gp37
MNHTKIEYVDHTWNPVTGCLHDCPYCYARRIAERFHDRSPGVQTGPGAVAPRQEWVQNLLEQCSAYDTPVFLKDNLGWPKMVREYPKEEGEDQ